MDADDEEFVWLWQAPEAFGPEDLVAASRAENVVRPFKNPTEFPEKFEDRMALINDIAKQIFPLKPATEELRAVVAEMIYAGELEAIGIQVAPAPSLEPEPVPRHMFSDPLKINWGNSRIKKSGREYEEIEVRWSVAPTPPPPTSAMTKPLGPRPNGRPTKQDEIHGLIDEITDGGFDLNSTTRKQACDFLCAEAEKRGFNTAIGYSDPVLKRALTFKLGPRK
jgi:hypothetical protein